MKTTRLLKQVIGSTIFLVVLTMISCATISRFSQYAYTQTTSLKVDALVVMDLAKDNYSVHQAQIQELQTNLQKIYEYEKNRPKNEISVKLWDKLLNSDGHLLGGYLKRWKDEAKLNETFTNEAKKLVSDAFDMISGLESSKIKPKEISE
jgi:hypothetical protein